MLRGRGIGNYGDYFTPEGFVPADKDDSVMPWMVIYPLGRSFSYEPEARYYKGPRWIIQNLIGCVARGGNFMVGIGPDASGTFHPRAVQDLEAVGEWLKVNGEGIYATRPFSPWHEGENVYFSRSKDNRCLYALCLQAPARELNLATPPAHPGLQVTLLGYEKPLSWRRQQDVIAVTLPEELLSRQAQSDQLASTFKFTYPEPFLAEPTKGRH
jgi:alpha-L-fucosidase